jgi:hypothetical protein
MKVKVTYTVDLEDIPERVDPLFESAKKNVEKASLLLNDLKEVKDISIEKCLKQIDELRNLLLEAELTLGDCDSMLAGYLNVLTNNSVSQQPPSGPST